MSTIDFCIKRKIFYFIQRKLNSNLPTIPSILGQEIKTNIFLRCNDPEIKLALDLKDSSEVEVFSKLRDLKDSF